MTTRAKPKKITRVRVPKALGENDIRRIVHDAMDELGVLKYQASAETVAKAAAASAVKETLMTLGIDMSDPIEVQRTFHEVRAVVKAFADPEFIQDMQHLRATRKAVAETKSRFAAAAVSALATGLFAIIVIGMREWFTK